jgi:hypothetical protein
VRSDGDPPSHIGEIRAALRGIDASWLYDVNLVEDLSSDSFRSRRLNIYLLGCFAAVALLFGSIPSYQFADSERAASDPSAHMCGRQNGACARAPCSILKIAR